MSNYNLFTSESVSEGHPDKMADQISDAVLDAIIADDPHSRVAVETMVKTGMAIIAGEVRTKTYVDLEQIVREHEKILSICSSGENPKDQIFSSIKAMSLEKVNTGIDSAFANGFIFKRDSLVKGPIINLGLTVFRIFFKFNSYLALPVSR